ncbi:hypothetical protein GCM10022222_71830 [Amycolatopsis ultiminotia]|uniref:Uncharacterized protein n=1 Tax=Amycolatopsis ultiminotia TaxID=543629 RepID=A0ABP6Y384_9PSEU
MTDSGNHISISGPNNGPMIFGGVVHGDVAGGTSGPPEGTVPAAELRRLVDELLALVRAREIARQAVVEDSLEELVAAADDPDGVHPAVPVSRWEKVKKLLGGAAEFAGLTVRISEQITKLWPN